MTGDFFDDAIDSLNEGQHDHFVIASDEDGSNGSRYSVATKSVEQWEWMKRRIIAKIAEIDADFVNRGAYDPDQNS